MAYAIAGSGQADPGLGAMLMAVMREYDEMPGLVLTADQARRLWALEPRTCSTVLAQLVDSGYLCQTESGQYVRPSAA